MNPSVDVRLLALGDSYTIGEAVDAGERWPVRLAAALRTRGVRVGEPEIIAKTGWATDELAAAIDAANPKGPYDLVTLLIGVNNQYRSRSLDEYREQFRALLSRAVAFAGGRSSRVVVFSIPDWGVTPFALGYDRARIAADIDAFNTINRDEAQRAGAGYVDITEISRHASRNRTLTAGDELHPSGIMYQDWVEAALPVVLTALGRG